MMVFDSGRQARGVLVLRGRSASLRLDLLNVERLLHAEVAS